MESDEAEVGSGERGMATLEIKKPKPTYAQLVKNGMSAQAEKDIMQGEAERRQAATPGDKKRKGKQPHWRGSQSTGETGKAQAKKGAHSEVRG